MIKLATHERRDEEQAEPPKYMLGSADELSASDEFAPRRRRRHFGEVVGRRLH